MVENDAKENKYIAGVSSEIFRVLPAESRKILEKIQARGFTLDGLLEGINLRGVNK